jgi:predicted DCC family thiol-disulfide oxidoreductase YuxK
MTSVPANPILLYDGVCGLCNRLNQFVLRRDRHDRFRFASLQSPFAAKVLGRHGVSPDPLDTVYVVLDLEQPGEHLLARSDAILYVLGNLGWLWRVAASLGRALPRGLRDRLYDFVARRRYSVFGKLDACPLPRPGQAQKFLDRQ